ncbi:MAG: hypothetical protein Q8O31_07470 [Rhodocyclaceae bacterium]|nr:hypothetical protein [Rhodocyclaceae bacterium]
MRKVFTANRVAAVLVGGLLMFNGFLPHRLMVGHVSYHGFALLPLLTLLLLVPTTQRTATMAVTTGAGILLAYWVHSGFAVIMLPALLSVALIAWMARMSTGLPLTRFAGRAMLAGLIGLGLSASKLWASFSFLSHFPRTFYALPGFATPWEGLTSLGAALFLPSQWAHEVGVERLVNVQWALAPHEWAYGFGPGVLLLLFWVKRPRLTASLWIWTGLILGLLMPLAISLWQADWNAFLKSLPLLGSMSNPLRWWITYIPAVAVVAGLALPKQRSNAWLAGAVLVLTMITSAWEPRAYYQSQNYDVRPILVADEALRSGGWIPKIERLGLTAHIQAGSFQAPLRSNDTFIAGVSQVFCYNPVFGYRLEKFVAQGLTVESVLTESDGFLNLKNPACYVFPKENGCLPGDRFRADQRASAVAFVNYRPFEFAISRGQMIANAISGIFLILVCVVGVGSFHYP